MDGVWKCEVMDYEERTLGGIIAVVVTIIATHSIAFGEGKGFGY